MRIAVVTTSYPREPGDFAGHFVRSEVDELRRLGHEVTVFAPGPGWRACRPRHGVFWLPGVHLFRSPGALPNLLRRPWLLPEVVRFVRAARREIDAYQPEQVIAHWLVPCAWPITLVSPAPCEIVVHGTDARLLLALPRAVSEHIVARLAPRDVRLRFVSADLQRRFVERFGVPWQSRSVVRPSPIVVPQLDKNECRRALGLAPDRSLALVVARLVSSKRVEVALTLAKQLADHDCVVIGEGPERAALQRRFDRVRFLGELERSATLRWICAADVLISASLLEGAPTVVREARALGTRVLAATSGDLEQWAASDPGIEIDQRLTG